MSRIAIKICGLSTPETLDAALKGGASHVGFVHFAKSPRHVDGDRLAQLAARVPGHVRKVGVVVNPDNAEIEMLVRVGDLDALQLHGSEAPPSVKRPFRPVRRALCQPKR
jgi:phosphoribosylanthranilate isomerase